MVDANELTDFQRDTIATNIIRISKDIIHPFGKNLFLNLGCGYFYYNPNFGNPLKMSPVFEREYCGEFIPNKGDFIDFGKSELARLRSESPMSISYNSHTWIGPPTMIGEDDDIKLMGALMHKFNSKYVHGEDFIRGFDDEGHCLYQKVIQFHSIRRGELEVSIQEVLSTRVDNIGETLKSIILSVNQ